MGGILFLWGALRHIQPSRIAARMSLFHNHSHFKTVAFWAAAELARKEWEKCCHLNLDKSCASWRSRHLSWLSTPRIVPSLWCYMPFTKGCLDFFFNSVIIVFFFTRSNFSRVLLHHLRCVFVCVCVYLFCFKQRFLKIYHVPKFMDWKLQNNYFQMFVK